MLDAKIFSFFTDLAENNNREWFNDHKSDYLAAKENFESFIHLLIQEIALFDKNIVGVEVKDCVFRIYRDIRFSNDKTPYKTHIGAYIAKGGRKSNLAGYYVHVEPAGSFLSGGIYMPPSNILNIIRQEIFENYDEFLKIVNDKTFSSTFGPFWGEKLKTPPRNYPKDFPGIELAQLRI